MTKDARIAVRLEEATKRRLALEAVADGRSLSGMVARAVEEWLAMRDRGLVATLRAEMGR